MKVVLPHVKPDANAGIGPKMVDVNATRNANANANVAWIVAGLK